MPFQHLTNRALYHIIQTTFKNTHLAGTVKASSQGCQSHNHSPAVVAFDSVERRDTGQCPHPAQVLL